MQQSLQAANAWRILFLLFLANLFNFFVRTIPAIIIGPTSTNGAGIAKNETGFGNWDGRSSS